MNLLVFAVRDSVSGIYDRPFCARSEGEAIRSFGDIAQDKNHTIGMHPEHFSLWALGMYDDNTAALTPKEATFIVNAVDCLSQSVEQLQLKEVDDA